MGGSFSSFSDSSYKPKITKSIRRRREYCRALNDILEQEDKFIDACVAIERQEQLHGEKVRQRVRDKVLKKKRATTRAKLQQLLKTRKELLIKVIAAGIRVQDLEEKLAKSQRKRDTFWSLTFEDDPEEKLKEWRENLRRTRSCSDVNKAVPRPPLVSEDDDRAIYLGAGNGAREVELENVAISPSMERLMNKSFE